MVAAIVVMVGLAVTACVLSLLSASAVAAGSAVGGAVVTASLGVGVRAWKYGERDDHVLVRPGAQCRHPSVISLARMEFVDVTAGPLERMFGLATVQMQIRAGIGDARIPGPEEVDFGRLRDQMTSSGESRSAGL
jgi:membrane protein YdbS with pleckstrin-like domain